MPTWQPTVPSLTSRPAEIAVGESSTTATTCWISASQNRELSCEQVQIGAR
jgi:hypothetical protein